MNRQYKIYKWKLHNFLFINLQWQRGDRLKEGEEAKEEEEDRKGTEGKKRGEEENVEEVRIKIFLSYRLLPSRATFEDFKSSNEKYSCFLG